MRTRLDLLILLMTHFLYVISIMCGYIVNVSASFALYFPCQSPYKLLLNSYVDNYCVKNVSIMYNIVKISVKKFENG